MLQRLLLFLLFFTACTQPATKQMILENLQTVSGEQQLRWTQGIEADEAMESLVSSLLSKSLTADSAVKIALLNNRNLQAKLQRLGAVRSNVVEQGLLANPNLEAKFDFGSGGTGFEISIVSQLLSLLYLPVKTQIAEEQLRIEVLELGGLVIDMAAEVRRSFYRYLLAEELLGTLSEVEEVAEASFLLASRLRSAGNLNSLKWYHFQKEYEHARLKQRAADLQVHRSREELNNHMGLWGSDVSWSTEQTLQKSLGSDEIPEALERTALERSLDLRLARDRVSLSARKLGITQAPMALLPELKGGVEFEREGDGEESWRPKIAFPIPLFNWGRAARETAEHQLRSELEELAALAVFIRAQTRMAQRELLYSKQKAEHLRTAVLPLHEKILSETQKHYNAMYLGAFDLLEAKQQELADRQEYSRSLADYWQARISLEQLLRGRVSPSSGKSQIMRLHDGEPL